ncbi:MAG: hypothetical protein HY042_11440 [Spirochaetia bacterium]|nr:hypothetical protein [Spirochaetia bacterium]
MNSIRLAVFSLIMCFGVCVIASCSLGQSARQECKHNSQYAGDTEGNTALACSNYPQQLNQNNPAANGTLLACLVVLAQYHACDKKSGAQRIVVFDPG